MRLLMSISLQDGALILSRRGDIYKRVNFLKIVKFAAQKQDEQFKYDNDLNDLLNFILSRIILL